MGKFAPVDENDFKARNVWPAGWYAATIKDTDDGCTERLSSAGNLMFETNFIVFNEDQKQRTVRAYILAEGKAAFQLRACAEAFGVLDKYRAGTLDESDLKGKNGYVKLAVQKDPNGVYPDKNTIVDYKASIPGKLDAKSFKVNEPVSKQQNENDLDDSIPF